MLSFFCNFCGTRTDGNTGRRSNNYYLSCPVCLGSVQFYISQKPTRTDSEIERIFQETELTDSQRGSKNKRRILPK